MAGRPLSPATRLRLGAPLPPLLADRTRAPPLPDLSFYLSAYGVLADVSICCPPALDSFSRVTHPSATMYSISKLIKYTVRLACVRHAASVRPEPGSNSPFDSFIGSSSYWLIPLSASPLRSASPTGVGSTSLHGFSFISALYPSVMVRCCACF